VKAIRYYRYGPPDVLALQDVDVPAVGAHDVLVRVWAASVNPAGCALHESGIDL
jgi:NADPH:quinone reductase-like Zn-dependent oxidoreductase